MSSSGTDAPPSQEASDLRSSQAEQMSAATANPMTGSVPATSSGPDSRTTGGASRGMGAAAAHPHPYLPIGPREGPDRRRGPKDPDDRELVSMSEVPAAEMGVGGAPAPRSLAAAAAEGRRQREEQEFRDLGGPERGTTSSH